MIAFDILENHEDSLMSDEAVHVPVMAQEVEEHLSLKPGVCIIDGTTGLAGHSAKICERIGPTGCLIAVDRDHQSLKIAEEKLEGALCQRHFVHDDFRNTDVILKNLNISEVDGILLDLGISSYQLENPQRGFSLRSEGPLDMRMDTESHVCAQDLVNSLSEYEISSILRNFGQERWHKRIARYLVEARQKKAFESTKELNDVIMRAIPGRYHDTRIHPATRSFQALRIAVNHELESLEIFLKKCTQCLKKGGRICVISFHSLEDRIVKENFRNLSKQGDLKLIFKKPLRPTDSEVAANPRARSARLRVAERI